jgi:thioredoxin-like negative regulator of GroEL
MAEYEKDQTKLITVRHIAETYEKLDRIEEAYSFFNYAWQLSNGDSAYEKKVQKLHDRISEIHLRQLEAWLHENPDHPDALTQQESLKELKQERALRLLTQSKEQVDRNPTDPQLRFEYGVQLYAVGKPAEAIPELQKAKSNPGIRSKAMLMLAQCFQARSMADMAARQLEELTKEIQTMDATKTEAVYLLGHMYRAMGKEEEALQQWKQIYEIDSGYKDVAHLVESSYGG